MSHKFNQLSLMESELFRLQLSTMMGKSIQLLLGELLLPNTNINKP